MYNFTEGLKNPQLWKTLWIMWKSMCLQQGFFQKYPLRRGKTMYIHVHNRWQNNPEIVLCRQGKRGSFF